MHVTTRRIGLAAGGATAALILTLSGPAGLALAHVGVAATSTAAGSSTLLTFGFGHGCDDSPTTAVAIKIPDGINAVTPTLNPNWTVAKKMQKLATPVTDAHGNQLTERVAEVVYTAKSPIPTGFRDALVLSLTLPEDAAGKTLAFPTVQTCSKGENAWVEVPAAGQDPEELESPAPTLAVTAAVAGEHDDDDHGGMTASPQASAPAEAAATGTSGTNTALSVTALALGAVGAAAGGAALYRTRKGA